MNEKISTPEFPLGTYRTLGDALHLGPEFDWEGLESYDKTQSILERNISESDVSILTDKLPAVLQKFEVEGELEDIKIVRSDDYDSVVVHQCFPGREEEWLYVIDGYDGEIKVLDGISSSGGNPTRNEYHSFNVSHLIFKDKTGFHNFEEFEAQLGESLVPRKLLLGKPGAQKCAFRYNKKQIVFTPFKYDQFGFYPHELGHNIQFASGIQIPVEERKLRQGILKAGEHPDDAQREMFVSGKVAVSAQERNADAFALRTMRRKESKVTKAQVRRVRDLYDRSRVEYYDKNLGGLDNTGDVSSGVSMGMRQVLRLKDDLNRVLTHAGESFRLGQEYVFPRADGSTCEIVFRSENGNNDYVEITIHDGIHYESWREYINGSESYFLGEIEENSRTIDKEITDDPTFYEDEDIELFAKRRQYIKDSFYQIVHEKIK